MANNPALFEEGEPLNVDKLNDLVTATNTNAGTISSLSNSTVAIQGTLKKGFPIIEAGQVDVTVSAANAKANKYGKTNITLSNIQASEFLSIVATPYSVMTGKETISVSISGKYPVFTIAVTGSSTWDDTATKINWIAVGFRATT